MDEEEECKEDRKASDKRMAWLRTNKCRYQPGDEYQGKNEGENGVTELLNRFRPSAFDAQPSRKNIN
jgi:hypothetical protein